MQNKVFFVLSLSNGSYLSVEVSVLFHTANKLTKGDKLLVCIFFSRVPLTYVQRKHLPDSKEIDNNEFEMREKPTNFVKQNPIWIVLRR